MSVSAIFLHSLLPYQIRQFLRLVERYDLRMKGES